MTCGVVLAQFCTVMLSGVILRLVVVMSNGVAFSVGMVMFGMSEVKCRNVKVRSRELLSR